MANIPVSELKPGMKLINDIRLKDGRLLLLSGFVMKSLYIDSLKAFGVTFVEVDDETLDTGESFSTDRVYLDAYDSVKSIMTSVREGESIDVTAACNTVGCIVNNVINNNMVLFQIAGMKDIDNYTYFHSLNVCIYSIVTGKALGLNTDELIQLGMGGLLHDMGKCKVPLEILMKPGKLTDEEFYLMKLHTFYGNEIILNTPGLDKLTATIALQHHEKLDGSGYPNKFKGDATHTYSKIVCIADIYDAITSDRVYKKKGLPHTAVKFITENSGILFDPDITDAFVSSIKLYPDNAVVVLNTGEIGRILKPCPSIYENPEIYVFTRKFGPPILNPYIINLADSPDSEIVEILK